MLVASPGGTAPDCLAPLPSAPEDYLGHFQSMHFHGLVGSRYQFGATSPQPWTLQGRTADETHAGMWCLRQQAGTGAALVG